MGFYRGPDIARDGIVIAVDAATPRSYPGSGTTWADISGYQRNGTLVNGPTFNSSNFGSIVLDGSNDSVSFGNVLSINQFTLCLWVYPGSSQVTYADIIDNNHRGDSGYVCQQDISNTNTYSFYVANGGAGSATSNFTLTANQWTFLTFTFSNAIRGYINGSLFSTGAAAGNPRYVGIETLNLGTWGGGGRNWNGRYASFIAYDRQLSDAEVLRNFNATRRRFGI